MHNDNQTNKDTYDLKRKRLMVVLRSIILSQRLVILNTNPMAWLEICCACNNTVQYTYNSH